MGFAAGTLMVRMPAFDERAIVCFDRARRCVPRNIEHTVRMRQILNVAFALSHVRSVLQSQHGKAMTARDTYRRIIATFDSETARRYYGNALSWRSKRKRKSESTSTAPSQSWPLQRQEQRQRRAAGAQTPAVTAALIVHEFMCPVAECRSIRVGRSATRRLPGACR
jgi:hypothetical protein